MADHARFRPTLSVLMAVHEHGGLAAACLATVRPLADEVIVAFDSRMPRDQLGPLESMADQLIGFEFSGPNRFRPWLREQARGDWLLLLDADEMPGSALLSALPELIASRNISGYQFPRWWSYPDPTHRLASEPWHSDRHLRLLRNDGRLYFPGLKHTGALSAPPIRFVATPFIHLNLIIHSKATRRRVVALYDEQKFGLLTAEGRPLNNAYYLPEEDEEARTVAVPAAEAKRIQSAIDRKNDHRLPRMPLHVTPAAEVERWWAAAPRDKADYRGEITVLRGPSVIPAGSPAEFELDITNLGKTVWPATALSHREIGGQIINLSYHWERPDGSTPVYDGRRTALTSRLAPGERVHAFAMVDAPAVPGPYVLRFDLVHEGVRWFGICVGLEVQVEPHVREQLGIDTRPAPLISLEKAIAARRRLKGPDALSNALRPEQDDKLEPPLSLSLGDWELDGASLNYLLAWIRRERFSRVLEFGSGVSTVAMARELTSTHGVILSVDQDPHYARRTAQWLAEHGLSAGAEVVTSFITEASAGGYTTKCYDFNEPLQRQIKSFAPELIVIDGPSQASGASRLAVIPLVAPLLERVVPFAMHDAYRDAEMEIARHWERDPRIHLDGMVAIGKGLLVGRLGCAAEKWSPTTPSGST